MNPKRPSDRPSATRNESALIHVSELMRQVEKIAGIRRKISDHFYDQPEVLAQIADRISRRVHK